MKEETRVIHINGKDVELPRGLTYSMGRIAVCFRCRGIVQAHEPLIHRSSYRNQVVEVEFPARNGLCIACSRLAFTEIVARWFNSARESIKIYNQMDQMTPEAEAFAKAQEEVIDSMQYTIKLFSEAIGEVINHKVEYAHEPQSDSVLQEDPTGTTTTEN